MWRTQPREGAGNEVPSRFCLGDSDNLGFRVGRRPSGRCRWAGSAQARGRRCRRAGEGAGQNRECTRGRVKGRTAADDTLKGLASANVESRTFPETNDGVQGNRMSIYAPTDDEIEFSTTAGTAKRHGRVYVVVQYVTKTPQTAVFSGLLNGTVVWKTGDPHVFVSLGWCTHDEDAADRLLSMVREELAREDLRLAVIEKLDWPPATPAEPPSQLLPPFPAPPNAPEIDEKAAAEKAGPFASPQELIAAYRQAYAKKDWRRCAICLSPAAQGTAIREFFFVGGVSPDVNRKLKPAMEKHLGKPDGDAPEDREALEEFQKILSGLPTGSEEGDGKLFYEAFRKRIADIPGFLADCWKQYPNLKDLGEIRGIVVEGDKASGFWTREFPPPKPGNVLREVNPFDLPRHYPCHFRRIDGGWVFADPPLSA